MHRFFKKVANETAHFTAASLASAVVTTVTYSVGSHAASSVNNKLFPAESKQDAICKNNLSPPLIINR